MTHWLLVSGASNFEISRSRGFDIAGMKERRRRAAEEVRAGDTVFFYLTAVKAIGGEARVTGEMFEDREPIWCSSKAGEVYPWRFPIELVKARSRDEYLPVTDFIAQYEYARKWPADHWTLAFQGNVHKLGDADYELIHGLL